MSRSARNQAAADVKIAGTKTAAKAITFAHVDEPRLRFDRVAVGLVKRLQSVLSKSVPDGRTVVVTITAPIRKDSKTGLLLEDKIRELLATGRAQLNTTINGNRIQVRVLEGGTSQTSKLIGFVHNPKPDPAVLFDITRFVLASIGSNKGRSTGGRRLAIANQDGLAPARTVRQVCLALGARKQAIGTRQSALS